MLIVETIAKIRRAFFVQGKPIKAICRELRVSRKVVRKVIRSDRGSQYASEDYRAVLQKHGLTGSMGRRGNPYDNAKAESFMKTLKVGCG